MRKLALLLLLGGCATPLEELYQQRNVCLEQGEDCHKLHVEINEREIRQEQREYSRISRCPGDTIEYCNWFDRGCGNSYKSTDDQYACISPGLLNDLLRF